MRQKAGLPWPEWLWGRTVRSWACPQRWASRRGGRGAPCPWCPWWRTAGQSRTACSHPSRSCLVLDNRNLKKKIVRNVHQNRKKCSESVLELINKIVYRKACRDPANFYRLTSSLVGFLVAHSHHVAVYRVGNRYWVLERALSRVPGWNFRRVP